MKKKSNLPDFQELCAPEQNHIAKFISQQIFFFFLCAVGGFFWEVLFMYVKSGHFANRGFLYGPWLPIYGVGAVLFYLLLKEKTHPLKVFLFSMLIGTGLELLIGWFLDIVWNLRYWDYSSYRFHYKGYICLWSALGFGIAGVLWICILSKLAARLWSHLSLKTQRSLNALLILLFLLDCAAALIFPNTGHNITF